MILKITLIGLFAGVIGTGFGGVISALFKKEVDRYIDFFMGLSGGIMLAVVVFEGPGLNHSHRAFDSIYCKSLRKSLNSGKSIVSIPVALQ